MPDMLQTLVRVAGQAQAKTSPNISGTPSNIGTALGPVQTVGGDTHQAHNRIKMVTDKIAYVALADGLYKSVNMDAAATFVLDHAFTSNADADANARFQMSGVYPVSDAAGEKEYLAGWFRRGSGAFALMGWRLDLATDTFSETAGPTPAPGADGIQEVLFGGTIHLILTRKFHSWNPIAQTWSTYSDPATIPEPGLDFCVTPDGLLRACGIASTGNVWRSWEFTSVWTDSALIEATTTLVTGQNKDLRPGYMVDGTGDAYFFYLHDDAAGSVGWRCKRFVSGAYGGVGVDITTDVLRPALRSVADGGSAGGSADKRMVVIYNTSQAGLLEVVLGFSDGPTTQPWDWNTWVNGGGSTMVFRNAAGQALDSLPHGLQQGGGDFFFSQGQKAIERISAGKGTGGQVARFKCHGGGTETVRFRHARKQQPSDDGVLKLGLPIVGGGTLATDSLSLENVAFDGATVHEVQLQFTASSPAVPVSEPRFTWVAEIVE